MKSRHLKIVVYVALFGLILSAATYAGKDKDKDEDVTLPEAVVAAIKAMFPNAAVEEADLDEEELEVYEVELQENGEDVAEVTVAPDGTIAEVESEVAPDALPQAVKDAIAQLAEGAEIKEAEKEVTYAVLKLVALVTPRTSYEVELIKDGKKCEIEVAEDGTVLEELECKSPRSRRTCKKHDDDNDNDKGKVHHPRSGR